MNGVVPASRARIRQARPKPTERTEKVIPMQCHLQCDLFWADLSLELL